MLKRCPGCEETYDPALSGQVIIADFTSLGVDRQEPIMLERFTAPDGVEYCCMDCFEVNG